MANRLLGSFFRRNYADKADAFFRKGMFRKAAELYVKAERFEEAAGAYIRLEEIETAVEMFTKGGDLLAAGELLQSRNRSKEAISYFERAGAFRQAAAACLEAQQYVRAGRLFEQAAMYRRAAECYDKAGEIEPALGAWELEVAQLRREGPSPSAEQQIRRLDLHRSELLSKLGRNAEAAQLLAEHGLHGRAARLFERARQFAEAAQHFSEANRPDEALRVLQKVDQADDALKADILVGAGRFREAAELLGKLERFAEAAEAYEKDEDWERAAELYDQAELKDRAAELFLRIGSYEQAGRAFAEAQMHEEAARAFRKSGDSQGAADAFLAAGNLLEAGRHYAKIGLETAARDALQEVPTGSLDYLPASIELLPLLLAEGLADGAEHRLQTLERQAAEGGAPLATVQNLYWRGRIAEERQDAAVARKLYQKVMAEQHGFEDAAERLARLRAKSNTGTSSVEVPVRPPVNEDSTSSSAISGATAESGTVNTDTQPIVLPVDSQTGTAPASPPDPSGADLAAMPVSTHLPGVDSGSVTPPEQVTGLPFKLEDRLEGWWKGVAFFRARDLRQQAEVLLVSFPLAEIGRDADAFRDGMKRVMPVEHPVILRLDKVIHSSDKILLLYEPFVGQTLNERLKQGHLSMVTALFLMSQLCSGLAAAHQLGVTHQWLSPQTILVDEDGQIKIAGLGMREILAHRDYTSQAYMSPELRRGESVIGPASDVYGLGQLALELLQAQLPADWSSDKTLDAETVIWPPEVEQGVPQRVRHQFVRCLSPNPLERPTTTELKTSLASFGLLPGQILNDRYEIQEEIGRGGMSRVYRAYDRDLEDEVAIKTVLTPTLGPSEDADRLLQEVRICRKLTHPNIVRVYDFGRFPGGIFIIMELLGGPGLDEIINTEAPVALSRARDILRDMTSALREAHDLDIVHRDLKPGNVLFHRERLRVLDFGIARMGDGNQQLTQTGQVIGSPRYMAPEQIQGLPLDGTCDLYALGVIAYTMLAGREPFIGENTTAIVLKHLHEPPPDIRQFRPDLPESWITLLDSLLAKKASQRPATAQELNTLLDGLPVETS